MYVAYHKSFYRNGFRPYGKTNPFAASQLSGVFPSTGGSMLHGLNGVVTDGSILTYTAQLRPVSFTTPAALLQAIAAAVNQDGLHVVNYSSDATFFSSEIATRPTNVKFIVQVANGQGFGAPDDVRSIIDHEFYVATGAMPGSAISLTSLAPDNSDGTVPANTYNSPDGASDDGSNSEDWSSWLQDNALMIGGFLALLLVGPELIRKV